MSPTRAATVAVPNDLESYWIPFTPNRAFKALRGDQRAKNATTRPTGARSARRTAGSGANAGHNREPIVAAIENERANSTIAGLSILAPQGVRAREPHRRPRHARPCSSAIRARRRSTRRSRSRSPITMRGRLARAADRARAQLSRRRLRRHRSAASSTAGNSSAPAGRRRSFAHLQSSSGFTKGEPEWGAHRRRSPHRRATTRPSPP